MSYIDDILSSAQGGQLIGNLAERFGLTPEQVENAIRALAPALELGVQRATEEPAGFQKLLGAMATPDYEGAYDAADAAHAADNVDRSSALLADLFGSPAAAGQVAQIAARETGLPPDILSQLLPILASVLLGGLFKNVSNQGLGGILGQLVNSGALGPILEQILAGGRASPQPAPGAQGGGLLGGLLGTILASLLGRGRGPAGGPISGPSRGESLDPPAPPANPVPAGLPEGLDEASLQQAIEQIRNQLQVGRSGSADASGRSSDLEQLIGQIFGKR